MPWTRRLPAKPHARRSALAFARSLGALALALPLGLVAPLAAGDAHAQTLKLRLLQTTDLHMNLVNYDYYQDKPTEEYGLAKTATLIHAARAEARNVLLFDNGDLLQGSPLGDYVARVKPPPEGQPHPAHRVMRALGYDAANIGNHEFNYGLAFVQRAVASAGFPYVNANIVLDEGRRGASGAGTSGSGTSAGAGAGTGLTAGTAPRNAFTPFVVLERRFTDEAGATQVLRVGVVGFVPPQVMQWDRQHLLGRVVARDIAETAREFVPRVRAAGADVVVAIAHSGFERGETVFFAENAVAKLAEVPGVDAVLFGHSHGEFPGRFFNTHPKVDLARGTINGIPAVMPGFWGSHLGVVDLVLEKSAAGWKVADGRAELRPVWDRAARKPLVAADPAVAALVAEEHAGTIAQMRSRIAETVAPLHSYFAQVADDPSVQLVSLAQVAYAKKALAGTPHAALPVLSAAAPFKTGGRQGAGYYTDIPAGPIALRNVADLYIYPNTLKVVKLTGAQVREWLEMSAGQFHRIDPAGPPAQNLVNPAFPSFNFDTIDGVTYRIDVTQPARYDTRGKLVAPEARRIVDLRFEGRPIDEAAPFAVVTNNYRASGGGNFPGLDGSNVILDAPDENREALVTYLRETGRIDATADGNWRIQPVPGVKLRFTAGQGALAHLARQPAVRLVQEQGDGLALFELAH